MVSTMGVSDSIGSHICFPVFLSLPCNFPSTVAKSTKFSTSQSSRLRALCSEGSPTASLLNLEDVNVSRALCGRSESECVTTRETFGSGNRGAQSFTYRLEAGAATADSAGAKAAIALTSLLEIGMLLWLSTLEVSFFLCCWVVMGVSSEILVWSISAGDTRRGCCC
jgi:hypothetical protein